MGIGTYVKTTSGRTGRLPQVDRKCLYCGLDLENDGSYLYRHSFCSDSCKQKYIAEGGFYKPPY